MTEETTEQRRRRLAETLDANRGRFQRWMQQQGMSQEERDANNKELDQRIKDLSGER